MNNPYNGLVVFIPTRNRASLAINAIRSVLDQNCPDVFVVVSDNSNELSEKKALSDFCRQMAHPKLRYITPATPLSMTDHWEWAIQLILRDYDVNHYTLLTDRTVIKPGEVRLFEEVTRNNPTRLISYNNDRICDHMFPIRVEQGQWTGQVIEISSAKLLQLTSRMMFTRVLPRVMNCIIPRNVIMDVQTRFGNVFDSIAPDHCFCFRCLELYESILYYDKSPLLDYALHRSNGMSQTTGVSNKDNSDFNANIGTQRLNYATPVPEFQTVLNVSLHEYCLLKQQTSSPKFPDVDRNSYFSCIAWEVSRLQNPVLKKEMEHLLEANGWNERDSGIRGVLPTSTLLTLTFAQRVRRKIPWLLRSSKTKPLWMVAARHFGVRPPTDARFTFKTREEAINYIYLYPAPKSDNLEHLRHFGMPWGDEDDLLGEVSVERSISSADVVGSC